MRINVLYYFKEALTSFRRNWVMSLASVTTIFISMLLVGAFVIVGIVVGGMTRQLERRVEVVVYLKDSPSPKDQEAFQQAVLSFKTEGQTDVERIDYVSKVQALQRMRERFKNDDEMLQQLQGNPLPASYEIKMKDPRRVEAIVAKIRALPVFPRLVNDANQDIQYGQAVVRRLFQLTRIGRIVFAVLIGLLAFASLVLIANTIRLAIFSRRKEIGIMRLVGASNWFIRWPLLVEGMFQGFLGALLAVFVIWIARSQFFDYINNVLAFMHVQLSGRDFTQLVAYLLLSGTLIGLAGSAIAIRRFLKV